MYYFYPEKKRRQQQHIFTPTFTLPSMALLVPDYMQFAALIAMEITQTEVNKLPIYFYVHQRDGT